MKLWKGATFAFMLCGAALSILLTRNMAAVGHVKPRTRYPHASSSSPKSSLSPRAPPSSAPPPPPPPQTMGGLRRRSRSADSVNSFLSEFSKLFQSFTEGELKQMVDNLLDRKRRKSRRLTRNQARRTKRARRPKSCSLRELELTVSELGLGYESDEILLFRYCSGKCDSHRHNYDITMRHMKQTAFGKRNRNDKVSNGPCCRPTKYEEDISFLDNQSRYHTIQNVSAQECRCV
ncbi:neurturin [Lampris incognitus]|uniref:neurturin n=1 Tax=Lampris incognitus TaxID=2546036 RepID=UPI0024B49F9A|nr:neurturin [Lampris incognitus]